MTDAPAETDVYCPNCAYNLRGVDSAACPECGRAVDRAALGRATLAWPQRKRMGWLRAYWRTVARASLRPGSLASETSGPVEFRDARRFWMITAVHAWTPVVIATVAAAAMRGGKGPGRLWESDFFSGLITALEWSVWPGVIVAVCSLLWIVAASGVASYFCHPKRLDLERQNRATGVSYYACAPLAGLAPVSVVCGAVLWLGVRFDSEAVALSAGWVGVIGAAVLVLMWYGGTLRVVRGVGERQWPFMAALAVGLPTIWATLFVLLVIVLPAMIAYAVLFVMSST